MMDKLNVHFSYCKGPHQAKARVKAKKDQRKNFALAFVRSERALM